MPIIRKVLAPVGQAISLNEIKTLLKITHNTEDNYLNILIASITQAIENYTNKSLLTQTWELSTSNYNDGEIDLYKDPIQNIESVKFILTDNTEEIINPNEYSLEHSTLCINKIPANNQYIKIQYKAGYGDNAIDLPEIFLSAIIHEVHSKYCNCSEDTNSLSEKIQSLLKPYCKYHL